MSCHNDDNLKITDHRSNSDNGSVQSDGTEPDVHSSDSDDSNPPGTPDEIRQLTDVMIQSPGRSFSEKDTLGVHRSILRGEGTRGSLAYSVSTKLTSLMKTDVSCNLPRQFLEWLCGQVMDGMHEHMLVECFKEIRELQSQWEQAGRDGFVTRVRIQRQLSTTPRLTYYLATQDIVGLDENAYKSLYDMLEKTWECQLAMGQDLDYQKFVAFLRCMK